MSRIAVSGHRGLPAATALLIASAVSTELRGTAGATVTGLSLLADGPDQIFARAVLEAGGQIEAVIPAAEYRDGLPPGALGEYDALLAKAVTVHTLPFTASTPESHMAASEFMIDHAEELWAVWDGKPARGYGGRRSCLRTAQRRARPCHLARRRPPRLSALHTWRPIPARQKGPPGWVRCRGHARVGKERSFGAAHHHRPGADCYGAPAVPGIATGSGIRRWPRSSPCRATRTPQ